MEEYANRNPVEREECKEIIQKFKELSVQLLDQCASIDEAQIVLDDHTGTSKFFRFSKNMMLPRLHLAIEHNHKEFIAHSLSQQVFRHFLEQGVPWHGKSIRLRIFHLLLQFLLAPIQVVISLFTTIGKDVSSKCGIDEKEPSLYGFKKNNDEENSWTKRFLNKTIDQLNYKQLSLNVPLNRYLISFGYYVIFVGLLVGAILEKALSGMNLCYGHYHRMLTFYVISMLWQDYNSLRNARSIKTFVKFWRMYDLIIHLALAFTLLFRAVRALDPYSANCSCSLKSCNFPLTPNYTQETTTVDPTATTTVPSYQPQNPFDGPRRPLYDFEDMLFAFVATMAITR